MHKGNLIMDVFCIVVQLNIMKLSSVYNNFKGKMQHTVAKHTTFDILKSRSIFQLMKSALSNEKCHIWIIRDSKILFMQNNIQHNQEIFDHKYITKGLN